MAIEFFWSLQTLKLNKIPSEIANMIVFSSKNTSWPKGLDMSRKKIFDIQAFEANMRFPYMAPFLFLEQCTS